MRAKENTSHPCGRSAGWTEIRGLGKREMKSLFLYQRMAGLPSGLSEKDLNVQVRFTAPHRLESTPHPACQNEQILVPAEMFLSHILAIKFLFPYPALIFTLIPHPAKPMLGALFLSRTQILSALTLLLDVRKCGDETSSDSFNRGRVLFDNRAQTIRFFLIFLLLFLCRPDEAEAG